MADSKEPKTRGRAAEKEFLRQEFERERRGWRQAELDGAKNRLLAMRDTLMEGRQDGPQDIRSLHDRLILWIEVALAADNADELIKSIHRVERAMIDAQGNTAPPSMDEDEIPDSVMDLLERGSA